jgi:hypothetical protein
MVLAHLDVRFASTLCTAVTNYRCLSGETFFFRDPDYQTNIAPNALQPDGIRMLRDVFRKIREEHVENA